MQRQATCKGRLSLFCVVLSEISFSADDTAGNFRSCIAGRLRTKMIRAIVNHHSSPDNILHTETICTHSQMRAAMVLQQRRQIARMFGMCRPLRMIVAAGIRKTCAGAASALMNVQGKETRFTVLRKSGDIRNHQNAPVLLIKPHLSGYTRCIRSALDLRHRVRADAITIHTITSRQFMRKTRGKCRNQRSCKSAAGMSFSALSRARSLPLLRFAFEIGFSV